MTKKLGDWVWLTSLKRLSSFVKLTITILIVPTKSCIFLIRNANHCRLPYPLLSDLINTWNSVFEILRMLSQFAHSKSVSNIISLPWIMLSPLLSAYVVLLAIWRDLPWDLGRLRTWITGCFSGLLNIPVYIYFICYVFKGRILWFRLDNTELIETNVGHLTLVY